MRNVISLLTVLCFLFPLFAHDTTRAAAQDESQNNMAESEEYQDEEANAEEYADDEGCVTEDDFMVGNCLYRWYITPSGARVLKCRRIYSGVSVGVRFGPWYAAYNYSCGDFHDGYFTYCPYCQVYYCSHPCHGYHHHHNFYFHPYYNSFSVNHYWKFYFPWRPWFHSVHHCSWIHGHHGWHWQHGKHCWHWHHGHQGKKIYHTKYWKHHGSPVSIRPHAGTQVHKVTTVNQIHKVKPVHQGTSIHKVKPVHNATQVKPMYKAKPVQQGTNIQKAKPVYNATPVKPAYKNNTYIKKSSTTPANQYTVPKTAKPVYVPKNNYNTTTVTRPANNPGRIQTPAARPSIAPRPAANGGAHRGGNANNNVRRTQSR